MKEKIELNSLAQITRKKFSEDAYSPIDIFAMVSGMKDITLVYYPMSTRISGMCIKDNGNIIVGINSNTSYGRQRYTLAHEMYHILYEKELSSAICELSFISEKNDSEKEADLFASYLLMPYDGLIQYVDNNKIDSWTLENVVEVEQYFLMSHTAMLVRLLRENYINESDYRTWQSIGITRVATLMGYSSDLYIPSQGNKKYYSVGSYIRKVEDVANRNIISEGKREEYLLDAFRADIVYNLAEEGMDIYD